MKRLLFVLLDVFFSAMLASLLAFPSIRRAAWARKGVELIFGRLVAPHYAQVIATYGEAYGAALAAALDALPALSRRPVRFAVDCGTGTGFASLAVRARHPDADIVGVDIVAPMLQQAAANLRAAGATPLLIYADLARTPLPDGCADLVVAQNTIPLIEEFGRLCAPGGVVVFADSSARRVAGVAARAMRRTGLFEIVEACAVQSGFYVIGRRANDAVS